MDINTFWQLIDRTRIASNGEERKWAELMEVELVSLPVNSIVEYQKIFDKLDVYTDRPDVMDVAHFIGGGLGDDGEKDFMAWLIGQGQTIYESVMSNPDNLADFVPAELYVDITAELLSYAGQIAYQKKMGDEDAWIPYVPDDEPMPLHKNLWNHANSWEEYYPLFKEKYPKTWAKFAELHGY